MGENNLLILGAGGYGHVVREIAEDSGIFDKIDFLDDSSPLAIGKFGDAEKFLKGYPNAVVALGNAELRLGYIEKLRAAGFQIPAIISPRASAARCALSVKPRAKAKGMGAHMDSTLPAALPSHIRTQRRFSAKYLYASPMPNACQSINHIIPSIAVLLTIII